MTAAAALPPSAVKQRETFPLSELYREKLPVSDQFTSSRELVHLDKSSRPPQLPGKTGGDSE